MYRLILCYSITTCRTCSAKFAYIEEQVNIYVARYIANITLASNLRSSQMGIKLQVAGP